MRVKRWPHTYAERAGRPDLICVFFPIQTSCSSCAKGDFAIDARGRRYFSNELILAALRSVRASRVSSLAGRTYRQPQFIGLIKDVAERD